MEIDGITYTSDQLVALVRYAVKERARHRQKSAKVYKKQKSAIIPVETEPEILPVETQTEILPVEEEKWSACNKPHWKFKIPKMTPIGIHNPTFVVL